MPTTDVTVIILHPEPDPAAGPLTTAVAEARAALARQHAERARAAGAAVVRIETGLPDGQAFGARLRGLLDGLATSGLVVLGSGAVPLATVRDLRRFVEAAAGPRPRALANTRYSADVVGVACACVALDGLPDLPGDNGLPRWLDERGVPVADLAGSWRLGVDVDGPLDLLLLNGQRGVTGRLGVDAIAEVDRAPVEGRIGRVRAVARDTRGELFVSGRTNAASLRWLERRTASRTRALIEERGLRTSTVGQRAPASVLGTLLDRDGAASLGSHLERLADAAVIDTRVLLAHRLGPDEGRWPIAEDRYASDLLLADRVDDPWLRALTASARDASIPVLLGGHTLVGPGLRLAVGPERRPAARRRG